MLKALYNLAIIFLGIAWIPKAFQAKYKNSLKHRLGFILPKIDLKKSGRLIWIHAVSMGETKAAAALAAEWRKRHPTIRIVVSSITETGLAEAKRSIPYAEAHFFLPLDLSWLMRQLIEEIEPSVLILVEGEFWFNLLSEAKKSGCKIALVNGKLSDRSAKRFSMVSWFAKALFAKFDLLCLQTEEYRQIYENLGIPTEKIFVTGNLKFDLVPPSMTIAEKKEWQEQLGIDKDDFVVVLGSTHEGEESAILLSLKPLFQHMPHLKVLIVPRHPHRFARVAEILSEHNISFRRLSESPTEKTPVVLIDTMGKLMACFQIAHIGVVCGSFVPDIGGHNLFEPAACGIPVLFGTYVDAQKAYAEALLACHGGISLPAEIVGDTVFKLYENSSYRQKTGKAALDLVQRSMGATKKTLEVLEAKSIA